jgi:hypothetical protein
MIWSTILAAAICLTLAGQALGQTSSAATSACPPVQPQAKPPHSKSPIELVVDLAATAKDVAPASVCGPANSPPLTAGTEPLGEAELPLTNNFMWQEENSSIRIYLLCFML